MRQHLRIIHADIIGEDEQAAGKQKRREGRLEALATHTQRGGENTERDKEEGQQRNDPAGKDVVAENAAERADQVERQRRIIVDHVALGAGIKRRARHRGRRMIGVPTLVGVERQVQTHGRDRAPEAENAEQRCSQDDQLESAHGDCVAHRLAQVLVGWMS